MTEPLPAPPLPATVDLRDFPYMPLDVVRLRDSDLAALETAEAFRAAVLLWAASWHQVPAGSLPDDDRVLANLAGFGRVVAEWRKVKDGALRGFGKCSDGRLYHRIVAEKALDAWRSRLERRWTADKAAEKKRASRAKREPVYPPFSLWITANCPEAVPYLSLWTGETVPGDEAPSPPGNPDPVPPLVPRAGPSNRREGKGSSSNNTGVDGGSSAPAEPPAGRVDQPPEPPPPSHGERILAECRRAKMPEPLEADPVVSRWIAEGFTPSNVANGIGEAARSWRSADPMPPAYADAAVRRTAEAERKARAQAEARVERTQAELEALRKAGHAPMPDEVRAKIPRRPKGEEAIP